MKRVIREIREELQVWHVLVACILVGVSALVVIRGGRASHLIACHKQAEEQTKEQVVQQLETLPVSAVMAGAADASPEDSRYTRAYRRCLQEIGIDQ